MKPIVILMPEKERESLCESGAIPSSLLNEENLVRFWPYGIDYSRGIEIAKSIADRPGDVPVFFGCPESSNSAEIDERTAEIVSILNSTMVHVVFLDGANESGKIEYGHFGSFKAIVDWSRSLVKVLRTRFVNEVNLHQMESVLVVVCRGQQIRVSDEEIREFSALIGENANNVGVDDLRPFVSCYFLNRELSIDRGSTDIFSSGVWDILVGRLVKAFVLSREQHRRGSNSERTLWMRPGIRIWKSEECFFGGAEESISRTSEKVLGRICEELRDAVVADGDKQVLSAPCPGYPRDAVEQDVALDYKGEWSLFDAAKLAHDVEVSERREENVKKAARSYFEWRQKNEKPDNSEMHRVFGGVKDAPRQLFAYSRALDEALKVEKDATAAPDKFRELVDAMAKTEERRKELVADLGKMAKDLSLAQSHYVGIGKGLFVFAAVTAMCGVTLWQVVTLMGGALATVLLLLVASAVGALAAVVAVVATHHHFGYAAAEAFVATCRDLDAVSANRMNQAREILCESVYNRLEAQRRNLRLRTHDLLARIRDVLVRELQYRPAIATDEITRHDNSVRDFERRQRAEYRSKTSQSIVPSATSVRTSDIEAELLDLWKGDGDLSFLGRWNRFCTEHDSRNVGHLPVSVFIPKVRRFMADFVREVRRRVRGEADEVCFDELKNGLKDWLEGSQGTLFYSGKAAVNTRASVLKRQVFIASRKDGRLFNAICAAGDKTVGSEFHASEDMLCAEGAPLALAIHEVDVELYRTADADLLALRQKASEDGT